MAEDITCKQHILLIFIISQAVDLQLIRPAMTGVAGYGTSTEITKGSASQLINNQEETLSHRCLPKNCDNSYTFKHCTQETSLNNNVSCCNCLEDRDKSFTLVCHTTNNSQLNNTLTDIGEKLPHIKALVIIIDNKWQGYYPFKTTPINLTQTEQLKDLRKFQLLPCYSYFTQEYSFEFENTTFKGMNNMSEFVINLPTKTGSHLSQAVKHFQNLQFLNLSFTRNLTMSRSGEYPSECQ